MFLSLWNRNHGYRKSFLTLLSFSPIAIWAPRVILPVSLRKYVFLQIIHAKLQYFKIHLDAFEKILPFKGKTLQFGLIHRVVRPQDRIRQLAFIAKLTLINCQDILLEYSIEQEEFIAWKLFKSVKQNLCDPPSKHSAILHFHRKNDQF